MAYGLPERGQHDYDDELNNSVEAVKSTADSAAAVAAAAQNAADSASATATTANNTANDAQTTATNAAAAAAAAQVAADTAQATAVGVGISNDQVVANRIANPASLTREALDALFESQPGAELGYAELEADFTTTNTTNTSIVDGPGAGGVIPQLTIGPIMGTGRPVSIIFHAPQVRHTTANAFVNAYLIINDELTGDGQNSLGSSPATNIGRALTMQRRLVLADGVPYTFKIGIQGGVAGTTTIDGLDGTTISLSVIGR